MTNLRPVDLELWSGNGQPGPYDKPGTNTAASATIEAFVHASTVSFTHAADKAGVKYHFDNYGPGTHTWPYWSRDLRQYLPHLAKLFAHPQPAPQRISYRSVARVWTQWGWGVVNHRKVSEAWSSLARADARRFVLRTTAPSATITTPRDYVAGSVHRITVSNGTGPKSAVARRSGRLIMRIRLRGRAASVAIR